MIQLVVNSAAGLIVLGLLVYGLVALCQLGLGKVADRRDRPLADKDVAYFGAITGGEPLSERTLREARRSMALASRRGRAHATVSAIARHYRRHGRPS